LQRKFSFLLKLVGGVDLCGIKLQLTANTDEQGDDSKIKTEGLDCRLCIGKVGIRLLDLANSDNNEMKTQVSVSSDHTELYFCTLDSKHDQDDDNEVLSIKNDGILINMNVSSNDTTSPQSSPNVTINRGTSNTCLEDDLVEIEVFSYIKKITSLLSSMHLDPLLE